MLVFFPSYGVMNACLSFWRQDASADRSGTIMDRISRIKQPVEEVRGDEWVGNWPFDSQHYASVACGRTRIASLLYE